jgi:ABC-type Fe3+ transport system substrate-binding protein
MKTKTGLLALALLCWASTASAQTGDAQSRLDRLIAEARKEGKVVVIGPPDAHVRKDIPEAFKSKYGITVEYIGGRGTETAAKLRAERSAGVYSADIAFGGSDSMAGTYYAEKFIAPLKPELIDPEVTDPTKWKKGKLWFSDPEEMYVLRLFSTAGPIVYINTQQVKPGELKSARDLLDPKWKGKISAHDPTVSGSGIGQATRFYLQFGEDYLKKLYVDQTPVIVRDRRQLTDGVARGAHPISLDGEDESLERLRKEGLPIEAIYKFADMGGTVGAGIGQMALLDKAPNPNAAKLFANWIASKEGLTIFSRARGEAPTRNDIDAAQYLPPEIIPDPKSNYFDVHDWGEGVAARKKVMGIMQQMLRSK